MIQTKKAVTIALLFPILGLAGLTFYKQYVLSSGYEVSLPISGYDPRDLLSGHYLIYQIDYGIESICAPNSDKQTGYVCLEPKVFSYSVPEGCSKLIRGICEHGRFKAGIERYYVPDDEANILEKKILSGNASVVLSVSHGGQAQVKDLLLSGRSWKNQ